MSSYRVGVIYGSRSVEHEVSIVTALQVMDFLAGRHEVVPLYITRTGQWLTGAKLLKKDFYKNINLTDPSLEQVALTPDTGLQTIFNPLPKGLMGKPKKINLDVIFPAVHGSHGEDGTLQGLLELADLPYVGSGVMASSICIDKIMSKVVLQANGLPVLDYVGFSRAEWENSEDQIIRLIESKFTYPVMVKPARLGSSIGVTVAHNTDELKFNLSVASHYDNRLIVEPCLVDKLEINCSVMGSSDPQASVLEQPITRQTLLSFEDKYMHGQRERGMEGAQRIIPAPLPEDQTRHLQKMAVDAFRCTGCSGVARLDFLLDQKTGKVYINEINTLPGSISFYLWEKTGLPPKQFVDKLLDLALQEHREKSRNNYLSEQYLLQNIDLLNMKK